MAIYLYRQVGAGGITITDINNQIVGSVTSITPLSRNLIFLDIDPSDADDATAFLAMHGYENVLKRPYETYTNMLEAYIPMNGISADEFPYVGEYDDITTGETGDYTTDNSMRGNQAFIRVNSITTGGDIVITGTTTNSVTGVVTTSTTETITVDTTTSVYVSDANWLQITNIDVSTGTIVGIDYDFGTFGVFTGFQGDFAVMGYSIDLLAGSNNPDIGLRIRKMSVDSGKKLTVTTLEDIGWDSTPTAGDVIDSLRTAGDDRSFTFAEEAWPSDTHYFHQQLDFSTYFASEENVVLGSQGEGLIVDFVGVPSGGISGVDAVSIALMVAI